MKRSRILMAAFAATALLFGGAAIADHHGEEKEDGGGAIELNGEYVWTGGGTEGPLQGVFTPAGEGKYDVSFHFEFRGRPHTYTGTAEGTIGEGDFRGKVFNESKERTFTFEGSFEDGRFSGTHAETTPGRAGETGTLWLE